MGQLKLGEKRSGEINLTEEIEIRRWLNEAFDHVAGGLSVSEVSGESEMAQLDRLARLLAETIEVRKRAEKEEKALKEELSRFIPEGSEILDLPSAVVLSDSRSRTDLDREALLRDHGADFVAQYLKRKDYKVMNVKLKRGG